MAEALRDAMRVALRTDPTVFLLGEDLGVPGGFGGGFTVTLGLSEEFGHDRVIDTPISEAAIVGAAVGAAMTGMRPVAEMQYGDFVLLRDGPGCQPGRQDALHEQWRRARADGLAAAGRRVGTEGPSTANVPRRGSCTRRA